MGDKCRTFTLLKASFLSSSGDNVFFCRIFSEKGLSRIEKEFPKLKFKGKGHEVRPIHTFHIIHTQTKENTTFMNHISLLN